MGQFFIALLFGGEYNRAPISSGLSVINQLHKKYTELIVFWEGWIVCPPTGRTAQKCTGITGQ
jgi:hypothetical protein